MSDSRTSGMTAKNIYLYVFITDDRNNKVNEVEKDSSLYKIISKDFHIIMSHALSGGEQIDYTYEVGCHLNDDAMIKSGLNEEPCVETQVDYCNGVVGVCLHIRKTVIEMPF